MHFGEIVRKSMVEKWEAIVQKDQFSTPNVLGVLFSCKTLTEQTKNQDQATT